MLFRTHKQVDGLVKVEATRGFPGLVQRIFDLLVITDSYWE